MPARRARQVGAGLAGIAVAAALSFAPSQIGGIGGTATACAQQMPTVPTIPTVGPVDPACSSVPDTDNDGVFDYDDNCNGYYNPSQRDTDSDSGEPPYEPIRTGTMDRDPATGGDVCDTDDDGDALADVNDNCQKAANKDQADADRDGIGDKCDPETTVPGTEATRAADGTPVVATPAGSATGGDRPGAPPGGVPSLTVLAMPRARHVTEIRAGLAVAVRCTAPCAVGGELKVSRKTARRMKLPRRQAPVLGRGSARLGEAGMTFVFVRVDRATLKRIAKVRKATATLRISVSDLAGGSRASVARPMTLRR